MPTVMMERLQGFAHCEDSMCPGNVQEQVEVTKTRTSYTYVDLGGDMPGEERSTETYRVADDELLACGFCGRERAAALQQRPVYPMQHDQAFLLKLKDPAFMARLIQEASQQPGAAPVAATAPDVIAAMQAQIAQLQTMLLARGGQPPQAGSSEPAEPPEPPRRGPGRPRKDADA